MFLAISLLLFALLNSHQVAPESKTAPPWPLFDFWNPMTWLKPKFSSQTTFHILRAMGESRAKTYEHLRKALLPANVFFGNIRGQFQVRDDEPRKEQKSKGSHRLNN